MTVMSVTIAPRTGLVLQNPVIAASGTFGYGVEFAARMDISGLGAIVCKGTTREPRAGNAPPRLIETAAGMLNAVGLQNVGVDQLIADKAPVWATWTVPVVVNVSGTSVDDYQYVISRLDDVPGVAGIELNVSCPNVREGGVMFATDPRLVANVTRAARQTTNLPLVVKLSPNVTDIRPIAAAAEAEGADAVSLINTLYGMGIDVDRREPALSNVSGGLSGPAIKPHALYLVYQVAQQVSIPVIGMGGIMSGLDAIEYLLAGATAVQVGTALLLDPASWREIVTGVEHWCRKEGVRDLREIVGAANAGFRQRGVKSETAGEVRLAGSS